MKHNPKLKADYKATKGYAEQRAFRQAWVAELWSEVQRKRTEKNSNHESSRSRAKFVPIKKAIEERGNDEEAGEAVRVFLEKVSAIEDESERARYVSRHPWTNQIEVAIPGREWEEGHKRKWEMRRMLLQSWSRADAAHWSQRGTAGGMRIFATTHATREWHRWHTLLELVPAYNTAGEQESPR